MLKNLEELKTYPFVADIFQGKLTNRKLKLFVSDLNEFLKDKDFREKFGFEKKEYTIKEGVALIRYIVTGKMGIEDIIEKPNPELLNRCLKLDLRLKYFPFPKGYVVHQSNRMVAYDKFIMNELAKTLYHDYRRQLPVGIRGVTISIGGRIKPNLQPAKLHFPGVRESPLMEVLSLSEVLEYGSEMPNVEGTRLIIFSEKMEITYHVAEFLVSSCDSLRELVDSDNKPFIFPAVLVYDLNKLKLVEKQYPFALPKSPQERSRIIIGIYILDYIKV